MTVFHMETESVRAMAAQIRQAAEAMRSQAQTLNSSAQVIDWLGPSRDEFVMEVEAILRQLDARAEAGVSLVGRLESEVMEWENAASTFERDEYLSSPAMIVPVIIFGGLIVGAIIYPIWWFNQTIEGMSRDEALKKIEDILDNTESGQDALQKAKELGVGFEISTAGSGTYYDPDPPPGTMYIDPNSQQDVAASSYIHELTHAIQHADGNFPDPTTTSKNEYIDACVRNEADAVIAEFRYQKENLILDKASQPGYETAYWDTYSQKLKELKHSSTNLSHAEMERIANEAGREKVIDAYKNGTIKTSTTGQSYVDYYGDGWEQSVKKI